MSEDADLVGTLELDLSEVGSGIRTEDALRGLLADALEHHPSTWIIYPDLATTYGTVSSTSTTINSLQSGPDLVVTGVTERSAP